MGKKFTATEKSDVAITIALKQNEKLNRKDLKEEAHDILKNSVDFPTSKKSIGNRIDKLEDQGVIKSEKAGRKSIKFLNPDCQIEIVPPKKLSSAKAIHRISDHAKTHAEKIIDKVMDEKEVTVAEFEKDLSEHLASPLSAIFDIPEKEVYHCIASALAITLDDIVMPIIETGGANKEDIILGILDDYSSYREWFKENFFSCIDSELSS